MKNHNIVPNNVKEWYKIFNKETKNLKKDRNLVLNDKSFWMGFAVKSIKENSNYTQEMDVAYKEWTRVFKEYKKLELQKLTADRDTLMYEEVQKALPGLEQRNRDFITQTYYGNTIKTAVQNIKLDERMAKINLEIQSRMNNPKAEALKKDIDAKYSEVKKSEETAYGKLNGLISKSFRAVGAQSEFSAQQLQELSKSNGVDYNLMARGVSEGNISPVLKSWVKSENKEKKEMQRNLRHLYYEGFLLGLTSKWSVKTYLEDRLVKL